MSLKDKLVLSIESLQGFSMTVIERYMSSIGRLEDGTPLTETLYSVVKLESGMYGLFEGESEYFSVSSEKCLDVCSEEYWEDDCDKSIHKWLSFHLLSVEDEVSILQEEMRQIRESLSTVHGIRRRLIDARIK